MLGVGLVASQYKIVWGFFSLLYMQILHFAKLLVVVVTVVCENIIINIIILFFNWRLTIGNICHLLIFREDAVKRAEPTVC